MFSQKIKLFFQNSWIRDGYCDKACNTVECDFDGGDCQKKLNNSRVGTSQDNNARNVHSTSLSMSLSDLHCSPTCANTWLADTYCDKACNNFNCAFDMGDCGVDNFENDFYHVTLFKPNEEVVNKTSLTISFNLPVDIPRFYVNFTKAIYANNTSHDFRISKAVYEDSRLIRSISAVNKFGILTVLMMPLNFTRHFNDLNNHSVQLWLEGEFSTFQTLNISLVLNLNAFNPENQTDPNILAESKFTSNDHQKSLRATLLRKLIQVKTFDVINAMPKKMNVAREDLLTENNKPQQQPEFKNKLFKNLYENYYEYLKWSKVNGYLTEVKLSLFEGGDD